MYRESTRTLGCKYPCQGNRAGAPAALHFVELRTAVHIRWRTGTLMLPNKWGSDISPASWSDERLVAECVNGNEEAWTALIEKYKNLIFSIPVKLGFSREDAGEIFQQ